MLFQVSVVFNSLNPSRRSGSEIWWTSTYVDKSNILLKTIEEVSLWNTGVQNGLDIQIQGIDSPSLLWQLKEYHVQTNDVIHPNNMASVIITKTKDNSLLVNSYRGQLLPFSSEPFWIQNLPQSLTTVDFYRWFFFRDSIVHQDNYYIWMKAELFVGNNIKFESRIS
jgi:hypothetical protein